MKQQNLNNELILTFDDVKDMKLPSWNKEKTRLLAIIEKEKKKK